MKKVRIKKTYCIICGKDRTLKNPNSHTFKKKTLILCIICSKCDDEDEKIFKEEKLTEILKTLRYFKYLIQTNVGKSRIYMESNR